MSSNYSPAWMDGYTAYLNNENLKANPFDRNTQPEQHWAWEQGRYGAYQVVRSDVQ